MISERNIHKMDKIAVLIPCYNEEKTIEKVVKDWKTELPEAVIYVYDNNSMIRQPNWLKMWAQSSVMNTHREKGM